MSDWTVEQARQLRAFLDTTAGNELLDNMREAIGMPTDGTDQGRTLVSAGEIRGRAQMLNLLLAHRQVANEVSDKAEEYPSLDDDSKWTPK